MVNFDSNVIDKEVSESIRFVIKVPGSSITILRVAKINLEGDSKTIISRSAKFENFDNSWPSLILEYIYIYLKLNFYKFEVIHVYREVNNAANIGPVVWDPTAPLFFSYAISCLLTQLAAFVPGSHNPR